MPNSRAVLLALSFTTRCSDEPPTVSTPPGEPILSNGPGYLLLGHPPQHFSRSPKGLLDLLQLLGRPGGHETLVSYYHRAAVSIKQGLASASKHFNRWE